MATAAKPPTRHAPGTSGRPAYKIKAEHSLFIDIRQWHRDGLMGTGTTFTHQWLKSGDAFASINVAIGTDTVTLIYFATDGRGNSRDASQTITTVIQPCHLGGTRSWFCCPACQKKAVVLFQRDGRFACRTCQFISYASQSETAEDRFVAKYHQLRTVAMDSKPKWQRWATRNRVLDRFVDASIQFDALLDTRECML